MNFFFLLVLPNSKFYFLVCQRVGLFVFASELVQGFATSWKKMARQQRVNFRNMVRLGDVVNLLFCRLLSCSDA